MSNLAITGQHSSVDTLPSQLKLGASLTVHISGIGDLYNSENLTGGVPPDPKHTIEGFSIELDSGSPYQFEYMAVTLDGIPSGWVRNGLFVGSRGLDG
ncbi:MAG TPA: hypothetical protein PK231_01980 [Acidocella sp.]|nr:hypothetical protein [Acidocella sp.]